MLLEHVSLALNPRGTLYRNRSLIEITDTSGNRLAMDGFRRDLEQARWTVYRVRRLYLAGKDKAGRVCAVKKGTAYRAVERVSEELARSAALDHLRGLAAPDDEVLEQRGITYVYRKRCALSFPTREEFLVAAPAVVEPKARYGLDWFEEILMSKDYIARCCREKVNPRAWFNEESGWQRCLGLGKNGNFAVLDHSQKARLYRGMGYIAQNWRRFGDEAFRGRMLLAKFKKAQR